MATAYKCDRCGTLYEAGFKTWVEHELDEHCINIAYVYFEIDKSKMKDISLPTI